MGGSQSNPRKISLENPDEQVFKLTESAINRIRETTKEITTEEPEKQNSTVDHDVSDSNIVFITSQQIRREVNNAIDKNNAYWENRLKVLKDGYRKTNIHLEEEFNKAVKEVNQSLGKHFTSNRNEDSCKQSKKNVIECYNLNKNQPLLCSEQVQKFNECVTHEMSIMLKTK